MKSCLITLKEPYNVVSESYKMFRTNLNYMNIDGENKVLLFTSPTAKEEKENCIANAAISFAQTGQKVLLIDGDFRKSRLHEIYDMPKSPGIINEQGEVNNLLEVVKKVSSINHLDMLTSGMLPLHPSELLGSFAFENMIKEARRCYDIILLNAPPVLSVSDAAVMSKVVDGVILIVAKKDTKREHVKLAKEVLQKVGANILGVLMIKAEVNINFRYIDVGKKKRTNKKN